MNYPKKILIVKLGSIGDVVNTLPLVNALKAGMPTVELGWLIEPKSYPIVEGHRSVHRRERGGLGQGQDVRSPSEVGDLGRELVEPQLALARRERLERQAVQRSVSVAVPTVTAAVPRGDDAWVVVTTFAKSTAVLMWVDADAAVWQAAQFVAPKLGP